MRVIRCDECETESHNPTDLYMALDSRWVMVEAQRGRRPRPVLLLVVPGRLGH